jgi:hypothetical protein
MDRLLPDLTGILLKLNYYARLLLGKQFFNLPYGIPLIKVTINLYDG